MQGGGNTVSVNVDLSDGSLISEVNSPDSHEIEAYPNDWYRVSVTSTTPSTSASALRVYIVDASGNTSFTGTVGNGVYFWGGQHEVGGLVTSYISTAAVAVTRAADVDEITGANCRLYNQTEGAVFAEDSDGPRLVGFNDGTDSNRHELFLSTTNVTLFQKTAGANEVNILSSISTKSAFAYKLNDYALSTGGGSVVTDTSATPPTVDQMTIGNWYNNTGQLNGHIKRLAYFPVRLPDATLQNITS